MLNKVAAKDPNNCNIIFINKQQDLWQTLTDEQVVEITETYQKGIKQVYFKKKDTIDYCLRELKKAEKEAEIRAVEMIKQFQKIKKRAKIEIESKGDELDGQEDDYGSNLKEELNSLENKLMENEMQLQNVLQEQTLEFGKKVFEMNANLKEKTNNFLQQV